LILIDSWYSMLNLEKKVSSLGASDDREGTLRDERKLEVTWIAQ